MRLAAMLASPPLSTGRAQDFVFALTLTNDDGSAVLTCAAEARFADPYGLPSWNAQLALAAAPPAPPIAVFRALDPRFGAPAPPWVPHYLKERGRELAAGGSVTIRLAACWLPRPALPAGFAGDSLLVMGETSAAVIAALGERGGEALYGRAAAALPAPGSYELTLWYAEKAACGFVPAQPIQVSAPPIRLELSGG